MSASGAIPKCANPGCPNPGTLTCARCRSVAYCSPKCQKAHWPAHKTDCKAPGPAVGGAGAGSKQRTVIILPEMHSFSNAAAAYMSKMLASLKPEIPSESNTLTVTEGYKVDTIFESVLPKATHITELSDYGSSRSACARFAAAVIDALYIMDSYAISKRNGTKPGDTYYPYDARFYENLLFSYNLDKFIPITEDFHNLLNTGWKGLLEERKLPREHKEDYGTSYYDSYISRGLNEFGKKIKVKKCSDQRVFEDMITEINVPFDKRVRNDVIKKWKSVLRNIQDETEVKMIADYATFHPTFDTIVVLCGLNHYTNLKSLFGKYPIFKFNDDASAVTDMFASMLQKGVSNSPEVLSVVGSGESSSGGVATGAVVGGAGVGGKSRKRSRRANRKRSTRRRHN